MRARRRAESLARRALLRGVKTALVPAARRHQRATRDPRAAQAAVLGDLCGRLAATSYGRHLGIVSEGDFRRKVPIVDYEDYAPWLERQRLREGPVVTPERVLFYEPTSGSRGARKLIPYTASLRRSFSRMFAVWAFDLLHRGPGLRTGVVYLSVSPDLHAPETSERGVPIGMKGDRDYLSGWLRGAAAPFVVAPEALSRDGSDFHRATCRALLAARDLEVISVWSPTFLQILLDWISKNRSVIAHEGWVRESRARALSSDPVDFSSLWPELKLVSCWASAGAKAQAASLAKALPTASLQGKGLLATEGPVTLPLWGRGCAPVLDEVLIELLRSDGSLRPLWEAREGEEYEVVLSQKGGLYRYRLGDRVVVTGFAGAAPLLEFLGRANDVSDLVGEKLSEAFAADVLAELMIGRPGMSALLVPRTDHYLLAVEDGEGAELAELARDLDRRLQRSHHYRLARDLGQLAPPRACRCKELSESVAAFYERAGIKRGDVKARALLNRPADNILLERFGLASSTQEAQ